MNTTTIVRNGVAIAVVSLLAGCASWNDMGHQSKATTEGATGGSVVGAIVAGPVGAAVGAGVGGVVAHNNAASIPTPDLPTANNKAGSTGSDNGSSTSKVASSTGTTHNGYTSPQANTDNNSAGNSSASSNSASNNSASTNSTGNGSAGNMNASQLDNDHQVVREAQHALNDKGYKVGATDGIMGPHTEKALRSYQQAQGLDQTGQLNQQTLTALGVQE